MLPLAQRAAAFCDWYFGGLALVVIGALAGLPLAIAAGGLLGSIVYQGICE